jgi:hypothetical protein
MTPPPTAAPRRRGRKVLILIIVLLVVAGLLFGLDRAAAAYTASRIATTLQNEGFPVRPNVSVEGFPFLTQLISKHLQGVEITAARFPVGSVTASIDVHAQNITLESGYHSGTIAQVTGTGLIPFASLARLPALTAVPGLRISADGLHMVKLSADLGVFAASAIARVKQTARNAISLRIVSSSGVPAALLAPIRDLVLQIPALPLRLTVDSVRVSPRGVVIGVTGQNVKFGQ